MDDAAILALIEADQWMMGIIRVAAQLDLPQWMIGGGVVRNKVWDHLHGFNREKVETPDIDLIYFDPADLSEATEKAHDARLRALYDVNWSCKNQARMHVINGFAPFTSAEDGLAHWRATSNSVAVRLRDGRLEVIAPYGTGDLAGIILRPTPYFAHEPAALVETATRKGWFTRWPKLKIMLDEGR